MNRTIRGEAEKLFCEMEWGRTLRCPYCLRGSVMIVQRDTFEVALMCVPCAREIVSEPVRRVEGFYDKDLSSVGRGSDIDIYMRTLLMRRSAFVKEDLCVLMGISRSQLDRRLSRWPISGAQRVREQPNRWRYPRKAAITWMREHGWLFNNGLGALAAS